MKLKLGFVPLNDAAPLVVAQAKGFFADEGLAVELSREVSWATVRDKVAVGALDGAHMLAPMVLAATLGVGGEPVPMVAPLALSLNGAAVTLSTRIAAVAGESADARGLAALVARRREQGASPLTLAVVFPYSIHSYLLRAWLAEAGVDPDADLRLTVAPPSRMAELLAGGVIEGFCAGEPWSTAAEAAGAGRVAVRAGQMWGRAPDKVFGTHERWAAEDPARLQAVLRALVRAASWAETAANRGELAEMLARPDHVGQPAAVIAAGLPHIVFHDNGANRPRVEDAVWLLGEMARWGQIDGRLDRQAVAAQVWRPDLFPAA